MVRTFEQVDQELYDHERPFYSYCAKGFPPDPRKDPQWELKRKELYNEWHKLYPCVSPPPAPRQSVFNMLMEWFK